MCIPYDIANHLKPTSHIGLQHKMVTSSKLPYGYAAQEICRKKSGTATIWVVT